MNKIQSLIDDANKGAMAPNTAYEDISQILIAEGIVKDDVLINPDDMLVHPKNRESLRVNAYNVHKNGNQVDVIGVMMKELAESACFEICPLEPMKSDQLTFNQKHVKQAKQFCSACL